MNLNQMCDQIHRMKKLWPLQNIYNTRRDAKMTNNFGRQEDVMPEHSKMFTMCV